MQRKCDKNKVHFQQNFVSNEYTFEQQNLVDVLQFTFENDAPRFSAIIILTAH